MECVLERNAPSIPSQIRDGLLTNGEDSGDGTPGEKSTSTTHFEI